jgi:two-component system chemotaxis response regulator CheY
MVMAALRPLQATFGEAGSGLEALEQLALAPYDAVTLDLNMPDMHGLEVLEFLRNHEVYRNLPVIVVSTRDDVQARQDMLQAGASAYITKPFQPADFLHEVKAALAAGDR